MNSLAPINWFDPLAQVVFGKRVIYFPNPGNVGDHLIDIATRNFFASTLTEISEDWDRAELCVFGGGGSLGSLYAPYMKDRVARMHEAQQRGVQCVVLPQSLTGGVEEFPANTIVFAREHVTQSLMNGSILVPDMALSFSVNRSAIPAPAFETGTFLRQGVESIPINRPNVGDPISFCHTWQQYLRLASRYEHVITNRLHFAIGALLTGRRATIVRNSYHKNRAMYESWLSKLGCEWLDE